MNTNLAVRGRVGDKMKVKEVHEVLDRFPVTPKVVRKGIATLSEAEEIANNYLIFHPNGEMVILSQITEVTVSCIVANKLNHECPD